MFPVRWHVPLQLMVWKKKTPYRKDAGPCNMYNETVQGETAKRPPMARLVAKKKLPVSNICNAKSHFYSKMYIYEQIEASWFKQSSEFQGENTHKTDYSL